jgi:hypothetical protein
MPASVAFDLDRFQKMVGNLAEQLGHPTCLSGAPCFFDFERFYRVDAKTLGLVAVLGEPNPQPS